MADRVFSTLAVCCPKLTAVVVMTEGDYSSASAFMKSKQTDLHGLTTIVDMVVEPHMVKHFEPCSDVLEPVKFFST